MAIKIFATLMGIFALVLVFLSTQDFYFIDFKPYGIDFKNVESKHIEVYELNSSEVFTHFQASSWSRYGEDDIFTEFRVFGYDYNLSANTLNLSQKNTKLEGNVLYKDVNQTRIEAQSLLYDRTQKLLSTQTKFKAYRGVNMFTGQSLIYDVRNKELNIKGVKAWLESN
ncbi:LPS export ABC transporter periplasmic protein LptC [Campylobacter sp. MIT 97-5078]|uniref:LPS export ABC transporter periplasmic protein LptC n=1 Tax=Campylobacter sp. MIT 97-5078 TaxID=1548153 RepID=UPI000512DD19|nr:LPS export ABC transporter periplasmic protein LptC [Campylobacter sp. MIT 97-5078]KGI57076.1 hypothetical protein LR59_04375 [Campylobacter sp. MIT 97-5078]TQR28099.1 hypothetical protein DMB91_00080 [Campylobacter sp. MIT 97-5078]